MLLEIEKHARAHVLGDFTFGADNIPEDLDVADVRKNGGRS